MPMATAILALLALPVARTSERPTPDLTDAGERAMQQDIDVIVGDRPVDRAEIRRRLVAEFLAGHASSRLREAFDDRWAGAFVEHSAGRTTLVVRLKGYSPDTRKLQESARRPDATGFEVRIVEGVEFTEAEIRAKLQPKLEAVRNAFPTFQGHYVDDATSEVVVLVARPELFGERSAASDRARAEREMSRVLTAILRHPGRVKAMPGSFRP